MSRAVRRLGAVLALLGLTGLSALGGVTALHVLLEHHEHHDTLAHAHGVDVGATQRDPHRLGPETAATEHSHPSHRGLDQAGSPRHDHVLVLTADLSPRSDRLRGALLPHGLADSPSSLAFRIVHESLGQPARAGPAPRAAPLSRRSVVLQV